MLLSRSPDSWSFTAPLSSGSTVRASEAERGAGAAPLVLLVDDDPDIRALLSDALAMEGYSVVSAGDGAEALERLRLCRPALIILDLMMPVMDGPAFIAAKNGDPAVAGIRVLAMTAATRREIEGAVELVRKPFDLDAFLSIVARHVEGA